MNTLLNSHLVRARRLELGLSERRLSAVTGLGQAVIRGVEAGINHKDLTLGELTRLADALAVTVPQLLTVNTTDQPVAAPDPAQVEVTETHVAQFGALLFDVNRVIPVESLALTSGLTLAQAEQVLIALDERLRPAGLLLHRVGNAVKLARVVDSISAATLEKTWKAHLARRGLDIAQAVIVAKVLNGHRTKTLTATQQVTVAQLTNAGLLTRTQSGGAALTPDVRYSLLLDEDDHHDGPDTDRADADRADAETP